ncbi:MAG: hypothetical protein FWF75_07580 [Propionibacteriaceae bacterium]|nr:hypothetical protein [Propionibacteriaceae bacterium]
MPTSADDSVYVIDRAPLITEPLRNHWYDVIFQPVVNTAVAVSFLPCMGVPLSFGVVPVELVVIDRDDDVPELVVHPEQDAVTLTDTVEPRPHTGITYDDAVSPDTAVPPTYHWYFDVHPAGTFDVADTLDPTDGVPETAAETEIFVGDHVP